MPGNRHEGDGHRALPSARRVVARSRSSQGHNENQSHCSSRAAGERITFGMGHGHDHAAGDASVSRRTRRRLTVTAVVLALVTIAGMAVLWPRERRPRRGREAGADQARPRSQGGQRPEGAMPRHRGRDAARHLHQDQVPADAGSEHRRDAHDRVRDVYDDTAPRTRRRRRAQPRREGEAAIRLHVLRPTAPPRADVADDPLRSRRDRARPAPGPRRAHRAGREPRS